MKNARLVSIGVAATMAGLFEQVEANDSGVWTNQDWFDENDGVGVKNGIPYGLDPET